VCLVCTACLGQPHRTCSHQSAPPKGHTMCPVPKVHMCSTSANRKGACDIIVIKQGELRTP
jgi:hypothetical protein